MKRRWVVVAGLVAGCGAVPRPTISAPAADVPIVSSAPASVAPSTTAAATTSTLPTVSASTAPVPPPYVSRIREIDDAIRARITHSWRSGCPVGLANLRLVELTYWGYDDRAHTGEMVVHAAQAENVAWAFGELYNARFPIQRIELVDVYDGNDNRSMVANNTSAFNCREVAGRPGVLSQHSMGTAIDINPLVNPWVRGSSIDPPEGAPYADRTVKHKGAIYNDDIVVRTFAAIGWGWGGHWPDSKDYQHFSSTGR